MVLLFVVCLVFLLVTTAYDVTLTAKGIAKKVAVEGNKLIVSWFGVRPTTLEDWIGALAIDCFFIVPAVVGLVLLPTPLGTILYIPGCFLMALDGVKHIVSGRKWLPYLKSVK